MEISNLTNHLLIAMPKVSGDFQGTVCFVCEHNDEGAVALIINKPTDVKLGELFKQLDIDSNDAELAAQPILFGGPMHQERGFVIHPVSQSWQSTLNTNCGIAVTSSQDILHDIAHHLGPEPHLISLGFASWGPGQLENELLNNYWLTSHAKSEIVFQLPFSERWLAAARSLGIDPVNLSTDVGYA